MISVYSPLLSIRFQRVSENPYFSTKKSYGLRKESLGTLFMNCTIHEVKLNVPYDFVFL